jgi:hypothetical protein
MKYSHGRTFVTHFTLAMLLKREGISESREISENSPDEEQLRICSKSFLK